MKQWRNNKNWMVQFPYGHVVQQVEGGIKLTTDTIRIKKVGRQVDGANDTKSLESGLGDVAPSE